MNSLMFSQKPLRMPGQLSLITSQLRKTFRTAPSFRKMLSTADRQNQTVSPTPMVIQNHCRAARRGSARSRVLPLAHVDAGP